MRTLRISLLLCIPFLVNAHASRAGTIIISQDTTISDNRFDDDFIRVVAGPNGSTTVRIVEGATVRGFRAENDSHVILDGGDVSFLSRVQEQAKFTMLSGTLGCIAECLAIDGFDGHIVAHDESEVHYYDGLVYSTYLADTSFLHVYGTELKKLPRDALGDARIYLITGTTVNGNPVNEFKNSGFGGLNVGAIENANVILHGIPEPTAAKLLVCAVCWKFALMGKYKCR